MMKCGMLSWSFRSKTKKSPRPARRRQAGPGLRPGAIQPRRLAAVRRRRNPLLISPSPARGNQLSFRFYRSPQRAKYSCAPGALMGNPFPAERIPKTAAASVAAWTELHRWGGNGRGKPTSRLVFHERPKGRRGVLPPTRFTRARRGNKDSDLRALGGAWN